jgi:hypothetical protein
MIHLRRKWWLAAVGVVAATASQALASDWWEITTLLPGGWTGEYTSLAVLPSGDSAISYYDRMHQDLRYAWRDDLGWHAMTVDSGGDVGQGTSLRILPSGQPAISYVDTT